MAFWDFFKRKKQDRQYVRMLDGSIPIFSQFGTDIYASDVVEQAVNRIAQEIKKLQPQHVRQNGQDTMPVHGHIQAALETPNPYMTTADFLEKIVWTLFANFNAFIIPVWEKSGNGRILKALYPIQPSRVDFVSDQQGRMFVEFTFTSGYEIPYPYDDVIHIRYNYSRNDLMGGDANGQSNNQALLNTLEMNHDLLQGVRKALKSSFAVNLGVKYNTLADITNMGERIKEFEKLLQSNESGILPMDLKAEVFTFDRKIQLVDEATLKFIDQKILRNYGVSLPILTGDYTKEQYEAFYQGPLEPLIIALTQGFSRALFTDREKQMGNKIMFYSKELIFMTTDQKLEMIRLLGDSGSLYENEKRMAFGMKPLPELHGKRMQSLNYVDVDIAKTYQLQPSVDQKGGTTNEQES